MSGMTKRDKWIPWYFVGAFLLLFVIDGLLVTIAVKTQSGVVVDKPYERGLAYNSYLAEAEAQAARGWKGRVDYQSGQVVFELHDKAGTPLTGATVSVTCRRAAHEGQDFTLALAESSAGSYVKDAQFPAHGQWIVEVSATWQNQPFSLQQTMFIP